MSDKKISLPPVKTYGLMSDAIERGANLDGWERGPNGYARRVTP